MFLYLYVKQIRTDNIKKDRNEMKQEKKIQKKIHGMSREANDVKLDVSPTFRRAIELWCRMYL